MISYIKGILVESQPGYAVLETIGIGYKIFIPTSAYAKLPQYGQQTVLYTSFIVRELSQALYGFTTQEERELFEELLTVTGVGPKLALSLIGHLPIHNMRQAVAAGDIPAISKVPGVGKKTAERLIVELRDKFYKKHPLPADFAIPVGNEPSLQKIADAMNALINLGYNQAKAQQAVKKSLTLLPESADLPALITQALKVI